MTAAECPRDLLTVDDLAQRFGISRSAAYRLARVIPSYRIPGVGLRFQLADVEAYIEEHRRRPEVGGHDRARGRVGMRRARSRRVVEVAPGLTSEQLKKITGY